MSGPGGPAFRLGALVTSTSGPFSDVSRLDGRFIIASPASVSDDVRALDPPTRAAIVGASTPPARDAVVTLDLALALTGLSVVNVTPATGTANVSLDSSVTVDFAAAVDPASVTEASAALQAAGTPVAVQRTLSADRRRLTLRPSSPLAGRTNFSVVLTNDIRDTAGNALTGYTPVSFTTLDPTRPPPLAVGQIVAELPDEDGFVQISGNAGTSASSAAVVATNQRTQESAAVLALADGSFRVRLSALVGDELSLILRDTAGRDTTIVITQFGRPGGATAMGTRGGSFTGSDGRLGSILPRSLSQPGVFQFTEPASAPLPALPAGFTYVDRFSLTVVGAIFNSIQSVTLSESQNRFLPQSVIDAPFQADGSLTTPGDALINTSLRFTATAVDGGGARRSVAGATTIVGATPDATVGETIQNADFPTVLLESPREAAPNQQVAVKAIAPTARVAIERPANLPGVQTGDTLLLVRLTEIAGEPKLELVDRLTRRDGAQAILRTAGHDLAGVTAGAELAIVATAEPLVFASGKASGAVAAVVADGLPFMVTTAGANGRFVIPVRASQPFTIRFVGLDGAPRGLATGVAPSGGRLDVGDPLGAPSGRLTLSAEPGLNAIVDLGTPVVFRFSEPIDARGLASAIVVLDEGGSRVFGTTSIDSTGLVATFKPSRRWR